jgi:hypothetical protein
VALPIGICTYLSDVFFEEKVNCQKNFKEKEKSTVIEIAPLIFSGKTVTTILNSPNTSSTESDHALHNEKATGFEYF